MDVKKMVRFESTISLGSVLQMLVLLGTVFTAYYNLREADIMTNARIDMEVATIDGRFGKLELSDEIKMKHLSETLDRIQRDIAQLSANAGIRPQ